MEIKLIDKIIEKYERSKTDWNKGDSKNRSLRIQQEEKNQIGSLELVSQAVELEKEKLVKIKWYAYLSEIEMIHYSLKDMPEFYARAGKIFKPQKIKACREFLENEKQKIKKEWIRAYYESFLDKLEKGQIPGELEGDRLLFRCLSGLDQLEEPVYKRTFSKHFLGNSKLFEKRFQKKILNIAKAHNPEIDDNMDKTSILSQLYLEEYSQELALKGNVILELEGQSIDLSPFIYGLVINSQMLKHAEVHAGQKIRKVITVENKANFMSMPYEEGTLIVFSHGYFTPLEKEFLKRLYQSLDGDQVEYFHTGDLDYGGIKIFQYIKNNIFPPLKPLYMDLETFERFKAEGEAIKRSTLDKLKRVKEPLLQELIDEICEEKLVIEQESLLIK
ncbi:MAG: DUF2399 domain-containing protein [Clostridiaceae bacterium]|nr:DUF2399 domain-containing protein [Clostridiaceae bacterium]